MWLGLVTNLYRIWARENFQSALSLNPLPLLCKLTFFSGVRTVRTQCPVWPRLVHSFGMYITTLHWPDSATSA
jgi:hypothetical protein